MRTSPSGSPREVALSRHDRPRLARRARLDELSVDGDGVAGKRADGRFGFPRLSLRLEVETDPADDAPSVRVARSPRPETVIEHNRREAYRPEA